MFELFLALAMLGVVCAGIFVALQVGNFSVTLSSARVDLQGLVRQVLDVATRDVRQSVSWEIANNNPSAVHMKFRQVQGWNPATGALALGANYIEYTYDAASSRLARAVIDGSGAVVDTMQFANITQAPFYTVDSSGAVVPLNQADLLTSRKVVVTIAARATTRGGTVINQSLTGEAKVRNE